MRSRTPDYKALAAYSGLFELAPTRAQRRMVEILEGAIRSYVTVGIESTTYDTIAKKCKVSRPLIQHYFKDKNEIFMMAAKYIRVMFQKIAVDAIQKETTPEGQLKAYVSSLFLWRKKFPLHAKVWNLVYYYAAVDPNMLQMHTELANTGHDRITALLDFGVEQGVFAPGDTKKRAKLIQTLYTGGLIMTSAENLYVPEETFKNHLIDGCLGIAKRAN